MAKGKITKLVHLSLQSSASGEYSPAAKGYGYVELDGESLYFDAGALELYLFDDLQVGQEVQVEKDPKLAVAKSIAVSGDVLAPPAPRL